MKQSPILEHGMYVAWAISLIATLGSLYFSEIMGLPPCTYCWYQRILMYPLTVILGMAAVKKDVNQSLYVMVLSAIGGTISLYHYLVQKTSFFGLYKSDACGLVPCDIQFINWFGFITIPFMALTAFILIFIIQLLVWKAARH